MAADYDLLVLGGSLEGRIAAITAVNYGARVALVEPPGLFEQRQQKRYLLQALQQLGEGHQRQGVVQWFQQGATTLPNSLEANWDWQAVLEWSAIASATQNPSLSPAAMNVSGIDVVMEMPERLSRQLVVTTATRRLKARGILAAFGTVPLPIWGDDRLSSSPTGIDPLLRASALPEEITVWGDSGEAVMWAEALCLMGSRVRLVSDRFLRFEDADVRRLVRSSLGGASPSPLITIGVSIIPSSDVLKKTNVNRQALADSSLLLGQGQPALVLPDFIHAPTQERSYADHQGHGKTYLLSNERLQTSHPRVFACGSLISGFPMSEAIAKAEAQVAVRNALFLPTRKMRYRTIPESYHRFARVGLTPRFAREGLPLSEGDPPLEGLRHRGYGNDFDAWAVWTASSPNSTDLSRTNPLPSFCKLICYEGRLQSVHLLGDGAGELIKPMAAMIGKPVTSLMSVVDCSPMVGGLADLVKVAVGRSKESQWQPGHWRRDWAENWFNWRRNR